MAQCDGAVAPQAFAGGASAYRNSAIRAVGLQAMAAAINSAMKAVRMAFEYTCGVDGEAEGSFK